MDADPNLKGYYVRTPSCDAEGNSIVDTGLLVVKPSEEEYQNIVESYLNTPYDATLGWNNAGHNHCDGKLGLPGFLSYYFSNDPGYVELDRCKYAFVADEECINQQVQEDATTALELANILENGAATEDPTTAEAAVANEAAKTTSSTINEVRVLPVDESHPEVSAHVVEEESIVYMEVYVMVMVSVRMMVTTTNAEGETITTMVMSNGWTTEKRMVEQVAIDPSLIQAPEIVEEPIADAFVSAAVTRPVVATQSVEVCGRATHCPPDDPTWTRSQQLACQELHSNYFLDKRRTELSMNMIEISDLIGQFKPRSFHGYCKGPGQDNYIGLKDSQTAVAPSWQIVCEPMVCPYGSYVTSECTCSNANDPCSACPTGTRCQTSPILMCIDCECGMCATDTDACCQS